MLENAAKTNGIRKIWAVRDLGDISLTLFVNLYPFFFVWHKVMKQCQAKKAQLEGYQRIEAFQTSLWL